MLERLTGWLAGDAAENLVPRYLGFNAPFVPAVCIALIVLAGLAVGIYYWRRLEKLDRRRRIFLVGLRVTAVMLVLFLAFDPAVVAQHVQPGEQFVALLFDDSLSMRIGGTEGGSRGSRLKETYAGGAGEELENRLRQRHQVVRYRVGENAEPLRDFDHLDFGMHESNLTGGIRQTLRDLEGATVSAVVLFSDGVQLSEDDAEEANLNFDVPVFTVGVDVESDWRDIELNSLSVKRTDFDKSPVTLTVGLHSTGLAGHQAMVEAAIGSRIVKSRLIDISDGDQDHEVRLEFVPDRKEWIEYEARVRLLAASGPDGVPVVEDRIAENNTRRFVIDNREKEYKILYVSGRPNWQNKFFRMALEDDKKQLKLTTIIKISDADREFEFRGKKSSLSNPLFEGFAEDKDRPRYDESIFLRLGEVEAGDFEAGYPLDASELYDFDLVIWGDVDRDFFSTDQLELTRDFVDKRGGALMMLGGPNAFTEGKYAGTIIERMMPVVLHSDSTDPERVRTKQPFSVSPTVEGRLAGSWLFEADEGVDADLWAELPPLYGLNRFALVRAGATVMAVAAEPNGPLDGQPVFAMQRYGEGVCAILASGDTWQWQMRQEHDDERHQRFWRQLVRNLVNDTPDSILMRDKRDAYTQDTEAVFEFLVRDDEFERREALQCIVSVTTPSGRAVTLPVEESIEEVGVYRSSYLPEEPGLYKLALRALNDEGEVVGELDETLLAQPDQREFQKAQYNGAFLRRLAESTGGQHFSLTELDALAEAIPVPAALDSEELLLHLWHLPGFYLALVLMLVAEWYMRRKAGQA